MPKYYHRFTLLILVISFGLGRKSEAQTASEGLLFAQDDIVGTARFNALGGAFTSLGGDWSGVVQNPAGLGVYRTSEFSISPAIHANTTRTEYNGNSTLDGKTNFNFGNLAFVGVQEINDRNKWRSYSFGFGLNRRATYHEHFTANTTGIRNTYISSIANVLNEENVPWPAVNDFEVYPDDAGLAWWTYLLDFDSLGNGIEYFDTLQNRDANQGYVSEYYGSKRETYFSLGANYDDKLYIGGGIKFSRITLSTETRLSESPTNQTNDIELSEYTYFRTDDYIGRGVSANFGLIYRPLPFLRIGWSIESPTHYYDFDYDYTSAITANYSNGDFYSEEGLPGEFQFRYQSPFRSNLGASYLFGKRGMISVDVEYVDYTSTQFMTSRGRSGGADYLASVNTELENGLRSTFNYRVGAEYRIAQFYAARVGYAHFANPYDQSIDNDESFNIASLGFGFRDQNYNIDLAYQYRFGSDRNFLYDPSYANPVDVNSIDHRLTVTFGIRF